MFNGFQCCALMDPRLCTRRLELSTGMYLGGGDNLRVVTNNGHIRKLKNYKMRVNGKFPKGSKQCTGAEDKWSNSYTDGQGRDKVIPYSTWPVWLREHSEYMNCQFVPAKTDDKMVCDVCLHSFLSKICSHHKFL
jgi:hypothetical protein